MNHSELIEYLKSSTATVDDQTALTGMELYPHWAVGLEIKEGERYQCEGKLYKCITEHITQDNWKPSVDTSSLWTVIDVEHEGTIDDPIPASKNMEYVKGKYYIEDEVVYLMNRESMVDGETITLAYLPSELVGQYFEIVE